MNKEFKNGLQFYKYLIIEAIMQGDDEDFLDLIWKLCVTEIPQMQEA
ncbi:MAG: hypothetical protein J6W28_08840 [Clostridia bacterium]|nr:hypothetical protein [Clostridia bacterium]